MQDLPVHHSPMRSVPIAPRVTLPPVAWRSLLALARFAPHLATNDQYGSHRDELAFLADAQQPARG